MKTLSKASKTAVYAEKLEDIIFENRNHEYGAYCLRSNYRNHVNLSLLIVVSLASLITLSAFLRSSTKPAHPVTPEKPITKVRVRIDEIILPPPVADFNASRAITDVAIFAPPIIVDKLTDAGELLPAGDLSELIAAGGPSTDLSGIEYVFTDDPKGLPNGHPDTTYNITQVQEQPMFRGGTIEDYRIWLIKNIKYPTQAEAIDLFGTVFIKFTIGKTGKIRDVTVQRSVHPLLDQAAVTAIETSPDEWRAARINGYPVNVSYTLPIKFSIAK